MVRMANLCVVGSNRVNGVSALHSELLRTQTMPAFDEIYPSKFCNVTNGITHRRWLIKSNPELSELISTHIGNDWKYDLNALKEFEELSHDKSVQNAFLAIKKDEKRRAGGLYSRNDGLFCSSRFYFRRPNKTVTYV